MCNTNTRQEGLLNHARTCFLFIGEQCIKSMFGATCGSLAFCVCAQAKETAFAEKPKDAFEESDDESAISRTDSELREVTKVRSSCLFTQPSVQYTTSLYMHCAQCCRWS